MNQSWQMSYACWRSFLLCVVIGCTPTESVTNRVDPGADSPAPIALSPVMFRDMTSQTGIRFAFKNSSETKMYTILESLGGGAAILDFDGDGWLDVGFPGGGVIEKESISGLPSGLFRNQGNWEFSDVSQQAGTGFASPHFSHAMQTGDYDADGFMDFLVTGYGGLQLWHNQGDGTLQEVHDAAGMDDKLWSSSAAWGDFNGDGSLDVYVEHYVNWSFQNHPYCAAPMPNQRDICPPRTFQGLPHALYYSNQDGTFQDVARELNLRDDGSGKGLGVLAADLDTDGDLDIYVCNDTTDNFLYLNDGAGVFEEVGMIRGVAVDDHGVPNGSMGVDLCDFNNDTRPDIWVANYEREAFALYRNEGRGQFLHVSQMTGVASLGGLYVGFGTVCADYDRDGDEDIVVVNGHVILHSRSAPRRQLPLILENDGRRFRRQMFPEDNYFGEAHEGRGLAAGDLDNDGNLDLVVSHINDPVSVLKNELSKGHWLGIRLIGRTSNRDAIGSIVTIVTNQGEFSKQVKGGGSYLSSSDFRLIWGWQNLPQISEVRVNWPNGQISHLTPDRVDRFIIMMEPDDRSGDTHAK